MARKNRVRTLGELRMSGYQTSPVKVEMRRNLISILREGKEIFPGIIGYDNTVVPQIENAILAGQDIVFLGERGQAKSRIMRLLVGLLDVAIPAIEGCEINDNPFSPVCRQCRERVREEGDNTGIMWLTREERYSEKLATPDITIADLIGDVDPIKVAEGRYLSDEKTIHYGLIPRTNRGILCINELPDLPERLQVGLFNVMEERDIQIRGYRIRLPLDTFVAASANPEDYTNRGRIITPLKDRFGAQVRTHYPADVDHEMAIMDKERWRSAEGPECYVPLFMKETIASITHLARKSPDVNQTSGVSVRVSISNYETIVSNSARRALTLGERAAVPRISDLPYIHSSTAGKIELESFEDGKEGKVVDDLIRKAVLEVFNRYYREDNLESIVARFNEGFAIEVSDTMNSRSYIRLLDENPGLKDAVRKLDLPESPEATASALEFVLEGLHLNRRLNKVEIKGKTVYRR